MSIELTISDKPYEPAPRSEPKVTINLPEAYELARAGVDTRGTYYVVASRKSTGGRMSDPAAGPLYKLFLGPQNDLRETPILDIRVYRDGGTTNIDFLAGEDEGVLYFPSMFKKEMHPSVTMNGVTLPLEDLLVPRVETPGIRGRPHDMLRETPLGSRRRG